MGTKNNPGNYDCYAKAGSDEPMFVLLARDPYAPLLVTMWARLREKMGGDATKIAEARQCAEAMSAWFESHADGEKKAQARAVMEILFVMAGPEAR
jgi:hypothetical protein